MLNILTCIFIDSRGQFCIRKEFSLFLLTDFPQMNDAELENFVQLEGSFNCKGTSCQCCVNVGLDFVSDSLEGQYKVLLVILT